MEALKELIKCTHSYCPEENAAFKLLFKEELDKCLKMCNAGERRMNTLDEDERKKIRDCFKENNCKMPYEHMKKNRDTPQFKALRQCSEEKCKEQNEKFKQFSNGFEQQ